MPQRNGQNPTRAARIFGRSDSHVTGSPASVHQHSGAVAGICPACKTEVPPRPGFRPSALKCPKCGTPLGKK